MLNMLVTKKTAKKSRVSQLLLGCVIALLPAAVSADNYSEHPKAAAFIDLMVKKHGFQAAEVQAVLNSAERKQSILDAISRPAEKTKTWAQYRKIFLGTSRTEQGRIFLKDYAEPLAKAEQQFGVPKEIITAIIGVETRYGRHKGSYRVIDALATLGFDYPPRSQFFSKELENYLLLVKEQQFDVLQVKGSYAGAMGYGQFIPSSYRHYAIDYDGDGIVDIVNNPVDAIGSVANYFKMHKWQPQQPVTVAATISDTVDRSVANQKLKPRLTVAELEDRGYLAASPIDSDQVATAMLLQGDNGEEAWLGLHNFYVITRYNHSELYAMSVYQLSETF